MWEFTREEGAGGRSRLSGVANLPALWLRPAWGEGTQTHSVGAAGTCLVPLVETLVSTPCTPMYLPSPLLPPHLFLIRLFHCKPTQAPEPHCPGYRWEGLCFHKLHPSPQRCSDAQHSVRTVVQPPGLDSRLPSDQCPWWP